MSTPRPAIGAFVYVRFAGKGVQVAHVTGHTSTGRTKVRAWNASGRRWMPTTRTIDASEIMGPATESARSLPTPPAVAG